MSKNHTISTLREHLFQAMEALQGKENPMEIERARAVAELGQVIINSAKVEVDHVRATGGKGSGFIPEEKPEPPALPRGTHSPAPGVLVHRIGDR
jgi:hypothetical protein